MLNICYESTKNCNLNCDYCITSDNAARNKDNKYNKIVAFIAELKPERLVISGGEPLLDPLLKKKLQLISEKMPNTYVSLSTNGSIKNFDFMSIIDYVDCIDISLPSLDNEIYKKMRGKGLVDDVKNNIDMFQKIINSSGKKIDLRISYTLTKVNKDSLKELLEFAKNIKVNSFRIGRFFPFRDASRCEEKYALSDNEIKSVLKNFNIKKYEKYFKIIPPIASLELMEKGYLTINYLGEIFHPCRNRRIPLGNISRTNPKELLKINEEQKNIFKNIDTKNKYTKYLCYSRIRESNSEIPRSEQEEYMSDRTRIIYSSAFRRLQQKAQVFSLEKNSYVRSRLSHSLEVSDVGRILASKITDKLICADGEYKLSVEDKQKIISIVENACLMHDIGNPPFGHFGESAIQQWWKEKYNYYVNQYNESAKKVGKATIDTTSKEIKELLKDFESFDGNPQGIRIVTRLYCYNDEPKQLIESGLNLTFSTIMCALKYVGNPVTLSSGNDVDQSICKKPGYFSSEKRIINFISEKMGYKLGYRFPFTYIMEAADDIAYCMSDISDGIEKKVITIPLFIEEFKKIWKRRYNERVPEDVLSKKLDSKINKDEVKDFNTEIASKWSSYISQEVVEHYVNHIADYVSGKKGEIISEKNIEKSARILKVLKEIANTIIYRSKEAEEIEVAGFAIVYGLLEFFGTLLKMPQDIFSAFVYERIDSSKIKKDYSYEFRVFNMLSKRCVENYRHELKEWENDKSNNININSIEWWLRVHLIIDHISGMTDDFALQTYQLAKGIDIKIY